MAGQVTTLFSDSAKTNELYPRTKTSAVSDANNHTLGDLAVYNAITVGTGVNAVSVGLDMDLLWHNASPTSSSSGYSIQDDLSDYKWFMFEVCPNYAESTYQNAIQYNFVRIGQDTTLWSTNTLATATQMNAYWMTRSVSATASGITVGGGYQKKVSDTSAPASNNNVCTVMNIYGIRGVINDLTGD